MSRVVVYAERTHRYEIEVEYDGTTTPASAIAVARRAIEDNDQTGVLSYWDVEEPLDFDVEIL